MQNDDKQNLQLPSDDFFIDEVEGDERTESHSLLQGTTRIGFSLNNKWVYHADGTELPSREYLFARLVRVGVKFVNNNLVEQILLGPNERFPDFVKLNAECPQTEWKEAFGKLRGPWSGQIIVYLVDPDSLDQFSWPAKLETKGAMIAIKDLLKRIDLKQRLCRTPVVPIVRLGTTIMPSRKYGDRPRPHFITGERWVNLNSGDALVSQALPAPGAPALPSPTESAPTQQALNNFAKGEAKPVEQKPVQTKSTPSLSEELDDSIPSKGDAGVSDREGSRVSNKKPKAAA
jgi:hypothetical protein